jgi:predicted lipoprotein with Yx(FWY)xxD motif
MVAGGADERTLGLDDRCAVLSSRKEQAMTRNRTITVVGAAVLVLSALVVAGCGGSSKSSAPPAPPKTTDGRSATIGVANVGLGTILVDTSGRTLYLFQKDTGTTSSCTGACAANWPPLRANGKPTLGSGANASMVGTTKRSDGKPQLTYNGHPLYLFTGDKKAGDTNGEGINAFGASWYAVSPAGNQVTGPPAGSGGGYGY